MNHSLSNLGVQGLFFVSTRVIQFLAVCLMIGCIILRPLKPIPLMASFYNKILVPRF